MSVTAESRSTILRTRAYSAGHSPRYVILAPWPVQAGSGVNNAILGLGTAMSGRYNPAIVVTGWQRPTDHNQIWLKLRPPFLEARKLAGFLAHFLPTMVRLFRVTRGAVAVNAHYCGPEILSLVLLRKLRMAPKLVISVHGADVTDASSAHGLQRKLYAWIYKSADAVIACSSALGSQVTKISPNAKISPVWNGVSRPPDEWGVRPLPSPYLVSVAAFVKKKGHDVLLHAFKQVLDVHPNLQLVLIGGDGPERASIEQLVRDLGLRSNVQMLLNLKHDDVWTWVRHAECFAHAPREEPFGIAVLEAALASTPIVTTAVGGIPEYLIDRVHGLTCRPDDAHEFAQALLETLANPTGAQRRAATFYTRASTFTWDAAWEQYKRTLELP